MAAAFPDRYEAIIRIINQMSGEKRKELVYFAYGSNMHPATMQAVCPEARAVGRGLVRGWRLIFRRAISSEPIEGAVLRGVLWSVSRDDVVRLDQLEDYPALYDRVAVTAADDQGRPLSGFMYVMRPERVPVAPPEPNYLALVLAAARQWDIPEGDIVASAADASRRGAGTALPPLPWDDEHWLNTLRRASGDDAPSRPGRANARAKSE